MRITSLQIENFRALELMHIVFHPMTVIIGENDVGKSSCMLAIKTLFESKKVDDESDIFKRERDRIVAIEATFDVPQPSDQQVPYLTANGQLHVRCEYKLNENRETRVLRVMPIDERFRNVDGQTVTDLRKTLVDVNMISGSDKPDKATAQRMLSSYIKSSLLADDFKKEWDPVKDTEFTKLLPDFVLVPVRRDLDANMKMTETSLLGKLFRPLLKEILDDSAVGLNLQDIKQRMEGGVSDGVKRLEELLRSQLNNQSVSLTHQVAFNPMQGIGLEFGMNDERVSNIPMMNRGAGVHNNLILAMFRLLAERGTKNFILAIEEPENSLHPRGQREMLWALQAVSKHAQVICTTHSSIFLDLGLLEDNVVLTRTFKGNTITRSFRAENIKELRDLLGIRISDALLSGGGNAAIIVEGPTELHAYPHLFRACGLDARALGISIIDAEGCDKEKIRRLLRVLNVYGIPSVVVLDRDAMSEGEDLQRLQREGTLRCLKDVFVLSEGTFESYVPLDIALEVINERYPEGSEITCDDIDTSKNREEQFENAIYTKKGPGSRFQHFKVQFGELVGRRIVETKTPVPDELMKIVRRVADIARED